MIAVQQSDPLKPQQSTSDDFNVSIDTGHRRLNVGGVKKQRTMSAEKELESEPQKKKMKENEGDKCCCCFEQAGDSNLWSIEEGSADDNVYGMLLQECFDITIGNPNLDGYKICDGCKDLLNQSLQFKRKVMECQKKLPTSKVKEKVNSSDSEFELSDLNDEDMVDGKNLPSCSGSADNKAPAILGNAKDQDVDLEDEKSPQDVKLEIDVAEAAGILTPPLEQDNNNLDENVVEMAPEPEPEPEQAPEPVAEAPGVPEMNEVDANPDQNGVPEPAPANEVIAAEADAPVPQAEENVQPASPTPTDETECVSSTIDDSRIGIDLIAIPDDIELDKSIIHTSAVQRMDAIFNCTLREMLARPSHIDMDRRKNIFRSINERMAAPPARSPRSAQRRVRRARRPDGVPDMDGPSPNPNRDQRVVRKDVVNYLDLLR